MALITMELDNDTRGWVLTIASGIACVFGASVICVDLLVRRIPGKENFRIQESNGFLACSLSLSFGVMLYSSLYSMLPESLDSFKSEGWSDQLAGLMMMLFFTAGFLGIQIFSRVVHQFMPSHVVSCTHSHADIGHLHDDCDTNSHSHDHARTKHTRRSASRPPSSKISVITENGNGHAHIHPSESTPLLISEHNKLSYSHARPSPTMADSVGRRPTSPLLASHARATVDGATPTERRPSMLDVQRRVISFVKDTKCNCEASSPCYGYSDPCGRECWKHMTNRSLSHSRQSPLVRTSNSHFHGPVFYDDTHDHHEAVANDLSVSPSHRTSRATSHATLTAPDESLRETNSCHELDEEEMNLDLDADVDLEAQSHHHHPHEHKDEHHHHVPQNAFMSIGLQTSIAIALHKFPEGFITYATNHANPTLGFNVFMALFVHNISEGFAMALPLYMALNSRWRAMVCSAFLGGLSQPIGAGLAALWFKLANKTQMSPDPVVYACLFAITAGIMVSVALQLFVESLSLNHNRNLCIFFAFLGMLILGLSNSLFAEH